MIPRNQQIEPIQIKSPLHTKTIVICCLLGLFVFLSSFSPAFFKVVYSSSVIWQAMDDQNFVGSAPRIVAEWTLAHEESVQNPFFRVAIGSLSLDVLTTLISNFLPDTIIRQSLDNLSIQYEKLLEGKINQLTFSLVPFKNEINGNQGSAIIANWLRLYPACSQAQITFWTQLRSLLNVKIPALCNPGVDIQHFVPAIQFVLIAETNQIPSMFTLLDLSSSASSNSNFSRTIQVLRVWRAPLILFPIIVLVLLFFVLFLNRRNLMDAARKIGKILLFTGLTSFALESFLYVLLNSNPRFQQFSNFIGFSGNSAGEINNIFLQVGNVFVFYVGVTAFGILTLGLVLILLTGVLKQE